MGFLILTTVRCFRVAKLPP